MPAGMSNLWKETPMNAAARLFAVAMLPAALALAGPAAGYDSASTSSDIDESCTSFTLPDGGSTLGATCNKVAGGVVTGTVTSSLDLDDYVGVDFSSGNEGNLKFTTANTTYEDFSDDCHWEYANDASTGLQLEALCSKIEDDPCEKSSSGSFPSSHCKYSTLPLGGYLENDTATGTLDVQ